MKDVVKAVRAAIEAGKRILVFGDFDVDGITSTTIAVRGLRALGATVDGLIPHRSDEGYALTEKAVQRGVDTFHPDVFLTVDCGISCADEVERMLADGLEVIVTDHHEPGAHVPHGIPLADPKTDPTCPSRDLAGAGVALKLICALGAQMGQTDLWREYTDFATLGTIADLMTLSPENRALVADGIHRMQMRPRPSILALCAICNITSEQISSTRLSFSLIPRLNAAGRMGDATVGFNLLVSDDVEEIEHLASSLEEVNNLRRDVESKMSEEAEARLATEFTGEPVIVIAGEGWHEGVKGIVASRISRKYHRPTIVFTIEEGSARGSGRTYGDINLFELAKTCSDLFDHFGGHAAAVGITLPVEKLDELRERLCAHVDEFHQEGLDSSRRIDTAVDLSECTVDGFRELDRLEPFGNGNSVPLLLAQNVLLDRRGAGGKQGNHFRYEASDGANKVAGIYFGPENINDLLSCDGLVDIVFEPQVDEFRGRYTAKIMTKDIIIHQFAPVDPNPVSERVDELFEHADEYSETGDYAGITHTARFNTKVVGVTFENRQSVLSTLEAGVELSLERQPENVFDSHAIAVNILETGVQLGFLNRRLAARLAPIMDSGVPYSAAVSAVTGGPGKEEAHPDETRLPGPLGVRDPGVMSRSWGVNIVVRRDDIDLAEDAESEEQARLAQVEQARKTRASWASLPDAGLDAKLKTELIGPHDLHDAQKEALSSLAKDFSTLVVMATGRGKSLIFHMHAARIALKENEASVFVYPLRALVADQAFHLQRVFGKFGLTVSVLTGETARDERAQTFADVASGAVDVLLTTPEFLAIHADLFAATRRIGFVVVDEAHHIGQSRAGKRPAYQQLSQALVTLGNPLVLAVTATANDETSKLICSTLGIQHLVIDPHVRSNLHIDDRRDLSSREEYIARMVGAGDKCIVYVNSRDQATTLARMLRHRVPELAARIAFYHAGLPKADRARIEDAFRDGVLRAIVSTSAFGEGIDIPDIAHVVLYHLPFSEIEFNQMAGRAGRDGRDAIVHLLYSYGDSRINARILGSSAPNRDQMVALYKVLKAEASHAVHRGEDGFSLTNGELAEKATKVDRKTHLDEGGVSTAIAVFRELGFLETTGNGISRRIIMASHPQRMDLEQSVRYREGIEEQEEFAGFKQWALGADSDALLARFNRPIVPEHPDELVSA